MDDIVDNGIDVGKVDVEVEYPRIPKPSKLIFSPMLAKHLLGKGYVITDLKQKREAPSESIFVFRNDEGLMDDVLAWKASKGEVVKSWKEKELGLGE
jgi:hypothetical protein